MVSEPQVRAALEAYVHHLQERHRQEWLDLFAEGATLVDPVPSEALVGRDAIGGFLDGLLATAERVELRCRALHVCGAQAAMEYTFVAGPHAGGGVAFDGVEIFDFDDHGLITSAVAYWQPSQLRQVDAEGAAAT